MIIESLNCFYHLQCFQCVVCGHSLGSGVEGTDVRVRAGKLHCNQCYSNDEGYYTFLFFFIQVNFLLKKLLEQVYNINHLPKQIVNR